MKLALKTFLAIFLVWLCAACSTKQSLDPALVPTAEYLEQHPVPTPEFWLTNRQGAMIDGSLAECALINQQPFHSDTAAQIKLDSYPVKNIQILDWGPAMLEPSIQYSSQREFCFDIKALSNDLHLATIELAATSGRTFSYMWAFRVTDEAVSDVSSTPAMLILPTYTPSPTP